MNYRELDIIYNLVNIKNILEENKIKIIILDGKIAILDLTNNKIYSFKKGELINE